MVLQSLVAVLILFKLNKFAGGVALASMLALMAVRVSAVTPCFAATTSARSMPSS